MNAIGAVFLLTGRGDGHFDVTWSGAAGENPVDLAIADLDEDGLADLAVAHHETDHVMLLFGIGGGAFEHRDHSRFRVDVSPHPHAVRLHDVDFHGHADLLVDDRSPESIRLFRGRGDGTFSGATSIDVGGDPYRGMSLADVTGDGLADLITPNPHVADAILGHKEATLGFVRYAGDRGRYLLHEKRDALRKWGACVLRVGK